MFSQQFLDRIYEAAFIPELWKDILDTLALNTNARGTMLHGMSDIRHRSISSDSLHDLMERAPDWEVVNSRSQLLLTLPNETFHSDADYFSEEAMAKDWLYTDYLWPQGMGYAAATFIKVPNGDTLILSIERQRANGPFESAEVQALTSLRPHLARSAMLASRLEFERIRGANQALQMIGLPSAAITRDGRVLDCNALFSGLGEQIQILAQDRLRLANPSAQAFLTSSLAALGQDSTEVQLVSRSFPLPATLASDPAVMHLLPVRGAARDLFGRAALFMVVTPVSKASIAPIEIVQGLFDLTVTEAKVAREIAAGKDPGQIAADFGVSVATIRYHLKSVFSKTGFTRQADLAATVAGIRTFT